MPFHWHSKLVSFLLMREIFFIFCFASLSLFLKAQIAFTTIVSPQQVEVGASFQVQYVIEGEINSENIKAPAFENFKFVTRHSSATSVVATGKGLQKVKKIIFTLKAIQPGKFIIHGASIVHAKKYFKSNDVFVQVITARESIRKMSTKNGIFNINLFLHPSEDPYKKIKENLFIKVQVNKQTCYTGEPVLATFKLYSSLQSKSDIVKNPGFYGFSVFDMLNLSDKEVTTEKVNGKLFDVHTIRKV